jgi:glycosyltransferase involved in cell wall biosynthesis
VKNIPIQPLVSVIMPCYGMGKFIGAALQGVGKQSYVNWEVIAVDDCGPEDDTENLINEFKKRYPKDRVEFIRNSTNMGRGKTRNLGISNAHGSLIALLDPDDCWGASHLEAAVLALQTADIYFCQALSIDDMGAPLGIHLGGRFAELAAGFPESLANECFLLTSSSVLKKEVHQRSHGFSEDEICEDWDYFLRALMAGYSFSFNMEKNCFYRKHGDAVSKNYLHVLECSVRVLRRNMQRSEKPLRSYLRKSLQNHLQRLVYLKVSFRKAGVFTDIIHSLGLNPMGLKLWGNVIKGLKNNWSKAI